MCPNCREVVHSSEYHYWRFQCIACADLVIMVCVIFYLQYYQAVHAEEMGKYGELVGFCVCVCVCGGGMGSILQRQGM